MKVEFLEKGKKNVRLILIYAGWSSTPELYRGISREGWDTAVVYDYRDFSMPEEIQEGYATIYLYAWSLGVFAAEQSLDRYRITKAFAINGSAFAVSDTLGIPQAIFSGTREGLNIRNLRKFQMRMYGGARESAGKASLFPENPDIEALKSELLNIEHSIPATRLRWHRAIISREDRIFPPEAQKRAWSRHWSKPAISEIDGPHFVDLKGIVESTIPDLKTVGEKFASSLTTYDTNAEAQRRVAARLTEEMTCKWIPQEEHIGRILEIGQGSGLLSHLYGPILKPEEAHFIDLCPTPRMGIAEKEHYMTGDAEKILEDDARISKMSEGAKYDLVVSSSAVQWFVDISRFFRNASRILEEGKYLVFATFGRENLRELRKASGKGLDYPDADELEEKAREHFRDVRVEEELIELKFRNPREAIVHLKRTGVSGGFHNGGSLSELLSSLMESGKEGYVTLTYHPIYVFARK